jgi:hypothetical protein
MTTESVVGEEGQIFSLGDIIRRYHMTQVMCEIQV